MVATGAATLSTALGQAEIAKTQGNKSQNKTKKHQFFVYFGILKEFWYMADFKQ